MVGIKVDKQALCEGGGGYYIFWIQVASGLLKFVVES